MKYTCEYCYTKVYWGFVDGIAYPFELDRKKKHTCKYDTPKRGITH